VTRSCVIFCSTIEPPIASERPPVDGVDEISQQFSWLLTFCNRVLQRHCIWEIIELGVLDMCFYLSFNYISGWGTDDDVVSSDAMMTFLMFLGIFIVGVVA
jgi:hypothetical protein